jgi:hypothetical protein
MALLAALASLVAAAPAGATSLDKEFEELFQHCPINTPGVTTCVYSTTTGGEFHLGSKTVPIEGHTIVLQGGLKSGSTELVPPTDGTEEVSKTPLTIPGGLVGLELLPPLTEVTATAEPAGPINVNVLATLRQEGTAVSMPLRVKLDNPLLTTGGLGPTCRVGTLSEPISLNLTTGTTSPPPPNTPITGSPGTAKVIAGGKIATSQGSRLVDNSFAAPGVNGCDEPLSLVADPAVDLAAGLPAAGGTNTAILEGAFAETGVNVIKGQLALPEIGRCVKVPSEKVNGERVYHGFYLDSGCTVEVATQQGKFEWEPGAGANKKFTGEGKTATLETLSGQKVTCLASTGSGEYTGLKTATMSIRFTGCTIGADKESCTSSGASAGELTLNGLQAKLGFVKDQALVGEIAMVVGWDLVKEPSILSATCGASSKSLVVTGSVIAPITGVDKMVSAYSMKPTEALGKQAPESFEEGPRDVLSLAYGGGAAEQAGLKTSEKWANGEKLEIKGLYE